ncbi:MAG: hypothetical protein LIP77_11215, partial [Planctomycetes bacterium]|nr:hypothetical protein [Planctomycetota bacterium]
TINTFPDLVYEIYRDGSLVGSMPHDTSGTAENGDTWSNGGSWQYYTDTHATPGENHEYRLVANLYSGGPLVEEFLDMPIPLPEFSSLSCVYLGGRSVRIQFYKSMTTFPDLIYEIYRDGAFVGSIPHDTSGTAENGESWSNRGFWQYYTDTHAIPGQTNIYRVIARLYEDGPTVVAAYDLYIPLPQFYDGNCLEKHGDTIRVCIYMNMSAFPDLVYAIYRDGEFIGEFLAGSEGENVLGNSWYAGPYWQYFVDSSPIPVTKHQYRIVATLYEGGPVLDEEFSILTSKPAFSLETNAYLPVIQRLASGEYLLAACINSQPFGPLAEMDIEVSGAGAVFTDSGLTTMRVPNAAFTTDGLVTMYIVAAADIDPDSASIQLRYQCVEID